MGETRVDLLHLLEDLRDAYPGAIEETILTEIVANSLDSGASEIALAIDPAASTLTIVDDGHGMRRRELARYHDIAATTKARGQGIGFAGVGIKLGLLVSEEVVTETRRGASPVATAWGLRSRQRAPWRWITPPGLVPRRGTGVRLRLQNPLSPLLDPGYVEAVLRRHFQPLLDPAFDSILASKYPRGVAFALNTSRLEPDAPPRSEVAPIAVRPARKRKATAAGRLVRARESMPEDQRGLAISTFGKVIKRGWDWLGLTPAAPDRIGGLMEVPALAECLTLNKADFVRAGSRGATYLMYRNAIQEAVAAQLAAWGDLPDAGEGARHRISRPVERDLQSILGNLADAFPLLSSLVERRAGGQRRLPMVGLGREIAEALESIHGVAPQAEDSDARDRPPGVPGEGPAPEASFPASRDAGVAPVPAPASPSGSQRGHLEKSRYGLRLQLASRPDDPQLARLIESTVWINDAHPAYRRAAASRSEGHHVAVAVALALAPLATEPPNAHGFGTAFLGAWGAATDARRRRRG